MHNASLGPRCWRPGDVLARNLGTRRLATPWGNRFDRLPLIVGQHGADHLGQKEMKARGRWYNYRLPQDISLAIDVHD